MTSFLSALVMYSKHTVRLEKGHLYIGGCISYIIIKNIYKNTFERYVIFLFNSLSLALSILEVLHHDLHVPSSWRDRLWVFCYRMLQQKVNYASFGQTAGEIRCAQSICVTFWVRRCRKRTVTGCFFGYWRLFWLFFPSSKRQP